MAKDAVHVLVVGLDDDLRTELRREDDFTVATADGVDEGLTMAGEADAVVVELAGARPLEVLEALRAAAPIAAILVVTAPGDAAEGTVALHAGAEDHLVHGSIPPGLLPRAIRYSVGMRRLRQELATQDDVTGLPNLRGFQPIAEHHLRMAERTRAPVVFLFVRLEELDELAEPSLGASLARDAAGVVLEAVRESDVPARVARDTFCVLLTGDAAGAETLVLSRLVEAIAAHNAAPDRPTRLSVSVGSTLYDPESADTPGSLEQILATADRRLAEPHLGERSEPR
jgi:diguanylate cyclase (GGDEF)-like protein